MRWRRPPGFFEIDLVAHWGHSLKGEHAWTLTATDVYTGWTENIAIRKRAHTRVVAAIEEVAPTGCRTRWSGWTPHVHMLANGVRVPHGFCSRSPLPQGDGFVLGLRR